MRKEVQWKLRLFYFIHVVAGDSSFMLFHNLLFT